MQICDAVGADRRKAEKFASDPAGLRAAVSGMSTDEINRLLDKAGREKSEQVLDAEIVLIAAGFLGSQKYVTDAFKVEVNERTNVKTENGKYKTNVDNVFTAGDMHRGQSLVVWAIREGREAAKAVDESLMGYSNLNVQ